MSWKGKTFHQVVSIIKKNQPDPDGGHIHDLFRTKPLKHYRRELLAPTDDQHISNIRISASVQAFERPNGYLVTPETRCDAGLEHILDIYLPVTKQENGTCIIKEACLEQNAKRRVRSSGMLKPKYDPSRGNGTTPVYHADTRQYLQSRNISFDRNTFHYIRQGDASLLTGTATKGNIYSPSGLSSCPKYYIPNTSNDTFFMYTWVNQTFYNVVEEGETLRNALQYEVNIQAGYYNMDDLNTYFRKIMEANHHYLIHRVTKVKLFFIKFVYNTFHDRIEMQCLPISQSLYPSSDYSVPENAWVVPSVATIASVHILNNAIGDALGFNEGYYPDITPWLEDPELSLDGLPVVPAGGQPYAILSTSPHRLFPLYSVVNYKPSNTRFAQQGAASSSARTLLNKFDVISRNGNSFAEAFSGLSNALAYGIPEQVKVLKEKIGYSLKATPVFPKNSTEMVKCYAGRKNLFNG